MIIITQPTATEEEIEQIVARVQEFGLEAQVDRGGSRVIVGVVGGTEFARENPFSAMAGVEAVVPANQPYKLAAFETRGEASTVEICGVSIGGDAAIALICGPCSVESREQILSIARQVKESGARILRGGAFKPRTSPYSFQGLQEDGLRLLAEARNETGLPVITEIMDARDLPIIERYADCLQIGTRNMHNFSLLKEVGRSHLPVLLKRGFSATVSEFIMSAEYILSEGNMNVLLCERGIRTFETGTRFTLDSERRPDPESQNASPGRGRSHPRRRPARLRPANVPRRHRRRRRRHHARSARLPRHRQKRRRPGHPPECPDQARPPPARRGERHRAGFVSRSDPLRVT